MAAKTDHALERLVFFSDAVFAIAITLLVIEIHAPHLPKGSSDAAHLQALADLIPSFVGYFVSFMVVGLFWMGHHRAFSLAARYSPRILGWNMALLGVIAFMPFVTAYVSANITQRVPTIAYCVAMLLAALLNFQTNRTATSPPMVDPAADPRDIRYIRQRGLAVILGSATAVVVAILIPRYGQIGLVSIPLWRLVLVRLAK
ncbi:MAG TPA: TMEM175 family protein [Allosphingosinicella sp.]|nr:TMEM175 family protein [Allosphingosinicella sp.]